MIVHFVRGTGKIMKFMKHRFVALTVVGVLTTLGLVLLFLIRSLIWHVIICIFLIAVIWAYIYDLKRRAAKERQQLLESIQRTASATLGHYRHDWMNDLQILYGYIQLGKIDKLASCVERIKDRMAMESRISRLGIPSLVFYLQSFREVNSTVQLEVDIAEGLELDKLLSPEQAEEFTDSIVSTIRAFQFTGRSSWGEIICLKMSIHRVEDEILVIFEQQGETTNAEALRHKIYEITAGRHIRVEFVESSSPCVRLRIGCA